MLSVLNKIARILLFNQAIAVPVGLIVGASNGYWVASFVVATVFAQCIGFLCWTTASALASRIRHVESGGRRTVWWILLYFLDGVVGAAVARQICIWLGYNLGGQSAVFSLAIGASIAVLVGLAMLTIHDLRVSLESSQQALRDRELEDAKLRQAKTNAELAALQARINPHFLFNTLNSIAALITEDPTKAEEATWQLSSLFRYTMEENTRSLVTVEAELTIVRRYLEIEKLRLGDRLRFEIESDPTLMTHEIPALMLQPLVENAIKHGIAPEVSGGTVRVTGERTPHAAVFTVADTGRGGPSQSGAGVGLDNVRQRLRTMYGDNASVVLTSEAGSTVTRVTLPL